MPRQRICRVNSATSVFHSAKNGASAARNVHIQPSASSFDFHSGRISIIAARRSTPRAMESTGGTSASKQQVKARSAR